MKSPAVLFLFSSLLTLYLHGAQASLVRPSHLATPPPPNSTLDYLEKALGGLDLALLFFHGQYKVVNLDAIIGTRIVEASFNVLFDRLEASNLAKQVPPYIMAEIGRLRDSARDVSDKATPYIFRNEKEYAGNIGPILTEGLFELNYDSRDISQSAVLWRYSPTELMHESESDNCLAEIFGTRTGKTCGISNKCWKQMTAMGYTRYSLSHQIFYLEIAEKFGCQLEMQYHLASNKQPSLAHLHDMYCANMMKEADLIAEANYPAKDRDLFMEQAVLCGMLGFREFFSSEWLDNILSWQDKTEGCYKWEGWPDQVEEESVEMFRKHARNKREEKRVTRGCLCHRTTVATGALAQYIRYILEVWFTEQL